MHTVDRGDDSAPVARIDLPALRANAMALMPDPAAAVVDLRADAWGHGAEHMAAALAALGVRRFLLDDHGRAALPDGSEERSDVTVDSFALLGLPGSAHRLRPVMSVAGSVLSVKDLRAGEGVSYGYLHRAASDTRVALVTGGYAQGIVRSLGGQVEVLLAGERHPIVGRIAMDVCVVDIGRAPVQRGDVAVFFGDPDRREPDLAAWTAATALAAAEITGVIGALVRRIVR